MNGAKGPETNLLFDLVNPNRDMFTRNDEVPMYAVIAIHPEFTSTVEVAEKRVKEALYKLIEYPENNIIGIQQEAIEMEGGEILHLTPDSLIMSLVYMIGTAKLVHLELDKPHKLFIH